MPKTKRQTSQHPATQGTVIRLEQPDSSRKRKPGMATVVVQEINPVSGFMGFIREHAVVSLAVGFAIATQAQTLIKQLIASFIDPLYALLFNSEKLSARTTTLHFQGREQAIAWGAFVYTLIDFLFVLLAIYAIIKVLNLDKLDSKLAEKTTPKKK